MLRLSIQLLRKQWFEQLYISSVAFVVLLWLQATPTLADPDSFYHAKMALLIRGAGGPIIDFPWLPLTILGQFYTDHHFLYHVLLVPFVTLFPPLVGLKLAAAVLGATLMVTINWFLRRFKVRWAPVFTLSLLGLHAFTYHISLARAPSVSLIVLLLGLASIFQHQHRRLFALGFTYVWLYGGFALLGVAAVADAAVSSLMRWLVGRVHGRDETPIPGQRRSVRPAHRQIIFVTIAGLAAGIVINPYFPSNLTFYYHQLINIGVINFRNVIRVGIEWYPYPVSELIANIAIASILVLGALLGALWRFRTQSKQTGTLFLLTVFFLLLTLKSRRYVEYYVPFAVLFSAFSISDTLSSGSGRRVWAEVQRLWRRPVPGRLLGALLMVSLLVGGGFLIVRDFQHIQRELRSGFTLTTWQRSSDWLRRNTPPGSRVVHSNWDEFPILFYHNSHNTYIAGLDPTFLYKADPDTYWTWVTITRGTYRGDLYQAVTRTLGSRYVFIARKRQAMDDLFRHHPQFRLRYQDDEAKIYESRPSAQTP